MHHATPFIATVLIGTALAAPALALAHSTPRVRWQLRSTPPPMTLLVALGPSDTRRLIPRVSRCRAPRSERAGLSPTVSGWTEPLGLRVALRW